MKNIRLYVLIILVSTTSALKGQVITDSFRSKQQNINIEENAKDQVVYLFNDYQSAVVYYPGEKLAQMQINYRLLADEMIIQGRRGSNQSLATGKKFDSLRVRDMTFIHHPEFGFLEKLEFYGSKFYIKHQSTYYKQDVQRGGYGQAPPSASTQNVNVIATQHRNIAYSDDMLLRNERGNEVEVRVTYKPLFGIVDNGEFIAFTSNRRLRRHFREHRSEIRSFIREHNIDLDKAKDMRTIAKYLGEKIK